jgi:hypothetical protein
MRFDDATTPRHSRDSQPPRALLHYFRRHSVIAFATMASY